MTPDLFSTQIVLDTSALKAASVSSAPFQVLKGLAKAGLVRVHIPQLAYEEFRTQWREKHLASSAHAEKELKSLSGHKVLPKETKQVSEALLSKLGEIDWEARSHSFANSLIVESGFELLPLTLDQCNSAWDAYFKGNLPSKKVKHRPDLPDAHIIAALAEFASVNGGASFVTADKGQLEDAEQIDAVECFSDLDDLVKSPSVHGHLAKWQTDQKWQVVQASLKFDVISQRVVEFVGNEGAELLDYAQVTDHAIPEDNHTATIIMRDDPDEIDCFGPEIWGGGLLRYQVSFFSDCLLSWAVYRGDAYHLPEWVSVCGEVNDHYLDAEGNAVVAVSVGVTVRIRVEDDAEGSAGSISEILFEDQSLELSLPES